MSVKVPIRTVYDGANAVGLAEFQSGEYIGLTHGGIGASLSIGTAGQVLKVNSGATALEFGNVEAVINIDGMTDGSGITLADSDKFAISDAGTEKYILASQITSYVASATSTFTNKTLTSPKINEDVAVTATATELNYTDGVTSNIQTQLDNKAAKSFAIAQAIALG
jgi:hypothetical protein